MFKILVFLLLATNVYAQNVTRVTSQSQHPYRHKATDLQSTAAPSDGQCASYDAATGIIEWTTCGSGGGGGSSELSGWTDLGVKVVLITSSDTVGIGTNFPSTKLDVAGTVNVGSSDNGAVRTFNGRNSLNFGTVKDSGAVLSNSGEGSLIGGYLASGGDLDNNGKGSIASIYSENGVNQIFGYSNGDLTVTSDTVVAGVTSGFDLGLLDQNNGNNFLVASNQSGESQYFGFINGLYQTSYQSSDTVSNVQVASSVSGKGNLFSLSHKEGDVQMFGQNKYIEFSSAYDNNLNNQDVEYAFNSSSTQDNTNFISLSAQDGSYQVFGVANEDFNFSSVTTDTVGSSVSSFSSNGTGNVFNISLLPHKFTLLSNVGNGTFEFAGEHTSAATATEYAGSTQGDNFSNLTIDGTIGYMGYSNGVFEATNNHATLTTYKENALVVDGEGNFVGIYLDNADSDIVGKGNFVAGAATNSYHSKVIGNYSATIGHSLAVTGDSVFAIGKNISTTASNNFKVGFNSTPSTSATLFVDSSKVGIGTITPTATLQVNGNIATNANTDDSVLVANGATFISTALPNCNTSTQKLNYTQSTNTWDCQTDANTGGTYTVSGTQVDFSDNGTESGDAGLTYNKTTDTLTIAGDLTVGGDDITGGTNTTRFVWMADGTNYSPEAIDLGTDTTGNYSAGDAEAGAALTGDSATGFFSTGVLSVSIGGTGQTAVTEDSVLVGSGTSNYVAKIMPDCTTGTINYTASTNEFSCGTDDTGGAGGAGSSTGDQMLFNDGGSVAGDPGALYNKTTDTLTVGSLSASNTGISYFNQGLQVNKSGGATSADIFRVHGDTDNSLIMANVTTDTVGIGVNSPTAKLDVNGIVNLTGLKYASGSTDDTVMVAQGTQYIPTALPPVCDATTGKLLYVPATNSFTCGTDFNTGGSYSVLGTRVDFSDGGVESGDAGMTYNKTTDTLTLGGDIVIAGDNIESTTETDRFVFMANGTTYAPEAVDLGTDTTGSYAAGDAEAGNATGVACTDCITLGTETSGGYAGSATEGGAANSAIAVDYNFIKSPTTNSGISFGAFTNVWTSTTGTNLWTNANASGDYFSIVNTTADLSSDTALLNLKYVDNGDANAMFLKMTDNGSAEEKLKVFANGDVMTWNQGSFSHLWTSSATSGTVFNIGSTSNPIITANASGSVVIGDAAEDSYFAHIKGYTADPCGTLPIMSYFWNNTADEPCVCTRASVDLRLKDMTTACF